jgi:hypothetical protein
LKTLSGKHEAWVVHGSARKEEAKKGISMIVYVGNQLGLATLRFYLAMAASMPPPGAAAKSHFLVLTDEERVWLQSRGVRENDISVFADWVPTRAAVSPNPERLERDYPNASWSALVASERAFTDYSFLFGASGHRPEKSPYTIRLLENLVTFIERAISELRPKAFVCQTADSLISHVLFKVAQQANVPAFAVTPAWLFESEIGEGGYFSNDEFLRCDVMIDAYKRLQGRPLTKQERQRVDSLIEQISSFTGNTRYHERVGRGPLAKWQVLSPQIRSPFSYMFRHARLNKDVFYLKINPWVKLRANLLRSWRHIATTNLLQTVSFEELPSRIVLFAMHFQPEQSTLAQGIFAINQIALIENISKALPLGYTLIVKEHPVGRGTRPSWQYRHIAGLPNVELCDAPAKKIALQCDAVLTITGTIAIEGLVLGKPVVTFGRSFFSYCDLITYVESPQQLRAVLREILVTKSHVKPDREERLRKFLMSYLYGLIPHSPFIENAEHYAARIISILSSTSPSELHHGRLPASHQRRGVQSALSDSL